MTIYDHDLKDSLRNCWFGNWWMEELLIDWLIVRLIDWFLKTTFHMSGLLLRPEGLVSSRDYSFTISTPRMFDCRYGALPLIEPKCPLYIFFLACASSPCFMSIDLLCVIWFIYRARMRTLPPPLNCHLSESRSIWSWRQNRRMCIITKKLHGTSDVRGDVIETNKICRISF